MKKTGAFLLSLFVLLFQIGCSGKQASLPSQMPDEVECGDTAAYENSSVPGYGT